MLLVGALDIAPAPLRPPGGRVLLNDVIAPAARARTIFVHYYDMPKHADRLDFRHGSANIISKIAFMPNGARRHTAEPMNTVAEAYRRRRFKQR